MNTHRSSDIVMRHAEQLNMLGSIAQGIVSASDLDALLSLSWSTGVAPNNRTERRNLQTVGLPSAMAL